MGGDDGTFRTGGNDDHSSTVTLNNRDGTLGFGVRQLKTCEGSGNDGHGAGAVGTVCCASPKGQVACDYGSSGQNVKNVVWQNKWKALKSSEKKELEDKGKLVNGKIVNGNGKVPASKASLRYLKDIGVISWDQYDQGMKALKNKN